MPASQIYELSPVDEEPDDRLVAQQLAGDQLHHLQMSLAGDPQYHKNNIDRQGRDKSLQGIDFDGLARDALSDEEYANWRAIMTRTTEEAEEASIKGEVAYARAYRIENLHGEEAALDDYKKAARFFITATAHTSLLNTHGEIHPVNPVYFFKIADALTKQAEAEGADKEKLIDSEGKPTNRRKYLGSLAIGYFNRGIDALFTDSPVVDDLHVPKDPSHLVANAVAEAAQDVDTSHEHKLLAPQGEEQLASSLQSEGPAAIKSKVARLVKKDESGLELIPRASQIINEELTGTHRFNLAA